MKFYWQLLAELAIFLDLEPEREDVAAAFDRLGFPHPAEYYNADAVQNLVVELERRYEAGVAVREYDEDGRGLLYYDLDAADCYADTRAQASARFVREVAHSISADFVRR